MTDQTGAGPGTPTLDMMLGYTDEQLLERAVIGARHCTRAPLPRWAHVKHTFLCGSTLARRLCVRFNRDPDQLIVPTLEEDSDANG